MDLRSPKRVGLCFVLVMFACFAVQAAPKLPANAIADDTFFIATLDFSKLDPATVEAGAKAALGDKLAIVDELLGVYKAHYEKYAGKGVKSVTLILRGDPDQQRQGPEPIFYVRFKPGSDQAAVEKQIREEEGENNPAALEITHDGDFMVLRTQGREPPETGSEERTKLFAEALGDSDKPVVAALIFNDALVKGARKAPLQGQPPGFVSFVTDTKWIRIEMTPGAAVKAELTIDTADEETAKRMADIVTGFGEFMKAQIAQMKQAAAQAGPEFVMMMDAAAALAEEIKPQQSATNVTVAFDAKGIGALLTGYLLPRARQAQAAPASKGGL